MSPRRRRLLTLGGCNTLEIGRKLNWLYEHTHIWSVTWPSLGSPPFALQAFPDEPVFGALRHFIERDANKSDRERIARGGYDIVLTTSQFTHIPFVVRGDACIADFTCSVFLTPEMLGGGDRPDIRQYAGPEARIVTWRDPEYLGLVVGGFRRAYQTAFAPVIKAGGIVVVYDHVLSDTEMTADGEVPYGGPDLSERLAVNRKIVAKTCRLPGVQVIKTGHAFSATAADAPWGTWEYHPIEEQYVALAGQLARLAGDEVSDTLVERHMVSMRQRALAARSALALEAARREAAEANAAKAAAQAADLQAALDTLRQTLSWRVTRPLRAIRRLTQRPPAAKAP